VSSGRRDSLKPHYRTSNARPESTNPVSIPSSKISRTSSSKACVTTSKRAARDRVLAAEPKGWNRFLAVAQTCYTAQRGCFSVNSWRDVAMLPAEAKKLIDRYTGHLKRLIDSNIRAEPAGAANAPLLADMVLLSFPVAALNRM
jgi:hypothetical protein